MHTYLTSMFWSIDCQLSAENAVTHSKFLVKEASLVISKRNLSAHFRVTFLFLFFWYIHEAKKILINVLNKIKGRLENMYNIMLSKTFRAAYTYASIYLSIKEDNKSSFVLLFLLYFFNFLIYRRSDLSDENLRASLCKILISSFAHKVDFAHNFSVDFF